MSLLIIWCIGTWDSFPLQVALTKHFFNWDSLHSRLNSHCKAWSYKKKKDKKIKAYRKSLQKEPTVNSCLLIPDLKPYHKTRTTEPSDGFLHLRETSSDTRWKVEHCRLFFVFLVTCLVDLSCEPRNFLNLPNTKNEMWIYPKMASGFGKHLPRAKSKTENFGLFALYPCYFFICCLAVSWLTFGYYWGNSVTHLMLITTFEL